MRDHFLMLKQAFGPNPVNDFFLAHARDYPIGPETFSGLKGEPKMCFMNALDLALANASMTYCEGKVSTMGLPIDHAWCIDRHGFVVDPTLSNDNGRIDAYFGVAFRLDYVLKAVIWNGVYGILDYYYAGRTAPQLYAMGLEEGQQWLLDQPRMPSRRRTKKAERISA